MPTQERKEQVEALCRELIRRRSYSGEERAVVEYIRDVLPSLNYTDFNVDCYGSITGHIRGAAPGRKILLDGHIDTVPANQPEWSFPAFDGIRRDDRILGRGASDMKGAVSAMLGAASHYAADHPNFAGDIYVSCVVQEECFEGVASRAVSEAVAPDTVIIGEATGLNLNIGQRGRAELVAETFGKAAHSANPAFGVNAVHSMMRLLEEIEKIPPVHHEVLGDGILVLTDIISDPYPGKSVVPTRCQATFDRRILVGETKDSILESIRTVIRRLEAGCPDFKATVGYAYGKETCYTGQTIEGERFFPAWLCDRNDPTAARALEALRGVGLPSQYSHYSFCTNGSHYAGEAGIQTFGFGPSYENIAHTVDEFIDIEQLSAATDGYYALIDALL